MGGHRLRNELGTIAAYLHSPYMDEWALRRQVCENTFGPLDRWPVLPENEVVTRMLGNGPWSR